MNIDARIVRTGSNILGTYKFLKYPAGFMGIGSYCFSFRPHAHMAARLQVQEHGFLSDTWRTEKDLMRGFAAMLREWNRNGLRVTR